MEITGPWGGDADEKGAVIYLNQERGPAPWTVSLAGTVERAHSRCKTGSVKQERPIMCP